METNIVETENHPHPATVGHPAPPTRIVFSGPSPVSSVGRLIAFSAAFLSTLMAIPGIGGLLMIAFLVLMLLDDVRKRNFHDYELLPWIGLCLFGSLIGFILNFWYWRIAVRSTGTRTRRKVWFASTVVNLALLVSLLVGVTTSHTSTGNGWIYLWMFVVFLMSVVSMGGFVEEFRPR